MFAPTPAPEATARAAAPEPAPTRHPVPTPAPGQASTPHDGEAEALAEARLILERRLYFAEYEPIIALQDGRVAGYEAMARFLRPDGQAVSPGRLFADLHADPALLLEVELAVKRHQLEHAPAGADLFVNLDPDAWAAGQRAGGAHPLLDLLAGGPARTVVEVSEALEAGDPALARGLVGALRARGQRYALGDVGAQNGLLSFEALDDAAVIKFDRILLRRLGHRRRQAVVTALAAAARATGARTVLEGIESGEDLQLARDLGVDLVQGWYFNRFCLHSPRPALEPAGGPR